MVETTTRCILYIDDDCHRYTEVLSIVAEEKGYEIESFDNLEAGLQFLNKYSFSVDAVLLDLGFPSEKMQGFDALEIIKKKYNYLPVIIVTQSDSPKDIENVVKCLKAGAFTYLTKRALNPTILLETLQNAIFQAPEKEYSDKVLSDRRQIIKDKEIPYIIYHGIENSESSKAVFGFKLETVIKYANERVLQCEFWHQNLLKTLNTPLKDIQIKLKYIVEGGKLSCYIFIIVCKKEGINFENRIMDTQYDVQSYFHQSVGTYTFNALDNVELLNNFSKKRSSENIKNYLFYRPSLPLAIPNKVFKQYADLGIDTKNISPVDVIDNSPLVDKKLNLNEEIFQALSYQNWEEIEIDVQPKIFLKEEIERLEKTHKEITNTGEVPYREQKNSTSIYISANTVSDDNSNTQIIIQNPSIAAEGELNKIQLEKYLTSLHDKYRIRVLLKREGNNINRDFFIKIAHYFFGRYTSVNLFESDSVKEIEKKEKKLEEQNSTLFIYDNESALQIFRLPYPDPYERFGIKTHILSHYHTPKYLSTNGIELGVKNNSFGKTEIKISSNALAKHLYVMGQTGTGKSTLLKTMIKDCLKKKIGFTLLDPHGDLYNEIYRLLSDEDKKRLVVIDTSNPKDSYTFNPLLYEKDKPYTKSLIVNEFIRAFENLYLSKSPESMGPTFELYMKNAMLLVMDEGNPNTPILTDIKRIFQESSFREWLVAKCKSVDVINFFKQALRQDGEQAFDNYAGYITSKLNRFIDDYFLRDILCGNSVQLNFRELIDENKILLLKMDKGFIGADNASLLGQLMINNITIAAMSRSNIDIKDRKQYFLFIDEFQNFVKGDVSSALSEVRKYGLSLIMANQTMAQLSKEMQDALLGNVGSMIFFRPGITDYETIKHYLEPEFNKDDVLKLPNFNCISRLLIDNIPSDPFVFQTKL